MKRTRKTKKVEPNTVLFIKKGQGMLRLHDGRVIKGGERFYARPEEIPSAFRDLIIPVEVAPQKAPEKAVKATTQQKADFKEHGVVEDHDAVYKLKQNEEDEELWDIVDAEGKVVNETAMEKAEADNLLKQLNP